MSSAPIVLVHGLATSSARTWGETGWLDLLADSGQAVVPVDLPGHGASIDVDPETIGSVTDWVWEQFPSTPVRAVGFSMGARILLGVAARHPEGFERLIVAGVGKNLFADADPERSRRIGLAIAGTEDPTDPEARYFHTLAAAPDVDRAIVARLIAQPSEPLTTSSLAAITCPVLVAIGTDDFAGPADELVEALPDARLIELRNTDHFATPKNFDFLDAALEFLGAAPF